MALWAPGSGGVGASGVQARAAAPCWDPNLVCMGWGRLRSWVEGWSEVLSPPPSPAVAPSPSSFGLFTSCLQPRAALPGRTSRRGRRRWVHTPFWQRMELDAGRIGPQPSSSSLRSFPLLLVTSRLPGAPFQLGWRYGEGSPFALPFECTEGWRSE